MTDTKSLTADHEAIASVLVLYLEGRRQGESELMRPAFHPAASFFGYAGAARAVLHLDVAGTGVRMTDIVTLLRTPEGWTARRWESEGT